MIRTTRSPAETERLAARLGALLRGGEALALTGELGAGKTTFIKGLAIGLGIDPRDVTSPTFLLTHELSGRLALRHVDAYRVGGAEELLELGALDLFGPDSVVAVEWAERVPAILPPDRLEVALEHVSEDSRTISLSATGPAHAALLDGLAKEGEA